MFKIKKKDMPSFKPTDLINLSQSRRNALSKNCKACGGFTSKPCSSCLIGFIFLIFIFVIIYY